ncbi:hypothetical protein BDV95DRAFT_107110 [Massariosphaeria phaeospora]|uniref:Uncharacterized protein n=1 Tax=Massariosphaeria phaeospora TaxID=100035 RepID=A0A7C8MBG1_9PLEO|nr:hypothetical protein BDV95DRAFT_107110 [Massariosphaeria phaeospora]
MERLRCAGGGRPGRAGGRGRGRGRGRKLGERRAFCVHTAACVHSAHTRTASTAGCARPASGGLTGAPSRAGWHWAAGPHLAPATTTTTTCSTRHQAAAIDDDDDDEVLHIFVVVAPSLLGPPGAHGELSVSSRVKQCQSSPSSYVPRHDARGSRRCSPVPSPQSPSAAAGMRWMLKLIMWRPTPHNTSASSGVLPADVPITPRITTSPHHDRHLRRIPQLRNVRRAMLSSLNSRPKQQAAAGWLCTRQARRWWAAASSISIGSQLHSFRALLTLRLI